MADGGGSGADEDEVDQGGGPGRWTGRETRRRFLPRRGLEGVRHVVLRGRDVVL